jgi:DNA-directed RNA polymerase specialized sigma24 family protein
MDGDPGFATFVAERRPALLRTALLLTGDRAPAEELVQRALRRARGSADPAEATLRELVRGATSRWTRLTRSEQVIEALPDPFAAPVAGRVDDLGTALRELPARTRAVLVLRWHEQLPDDRIAALLRCPVATVEAEATTGLDRLAPLLAASVFERDVAAVPAEERLTTQLARLADAPGRWRLSPAEAFTDVAARRSGARRRLVGGAVAAACVLGAVVPLARWAPDPPAQPPPPAPTSVTERTPAPIAPRALPVLAGPTRGSLAGDEAFVTDVQGADWGALEPPPPYQRTVVLAEDTPHGRVALVVGTVLEDFRGVWLTGPVGAAAEDLVPHVPPGLGRDRPLTLLLGGPGDATLVVVAAPGDAIAVSDRLMTGPRGTVGRTYETAADDDGVAVLPARTTTLGPALSVRVERAGWEVYRSPVDWPAGGSAPPPLPDLLALRAGPGAPAGHVVDAALTDLAVPLGVEPATLAPELLWSAELPLGRGTGTVAVVVAHSPGGALVVTTWAGVGAGAVACGTQTPPGTTDVATLTIARICDVALPGLGQTDDGRWLVVSAPADAIGAELLDGRGRVLRAVGLTGGGAVVAAPEDARTVRTIGAGGAPLRETPIAPTPTEPFGDFGSGPLN